MLKPGSTIGILGGGQLGRMLALAGARLGLKSHIFAPEADSPAFDVSASRTIAAYDNQVALSDFARAVDVVTYEFENVPATTVDFLTPKVAVRPGAKALRTAQDRLAEKELARRLGAMTARFAAVDTLSDLEKGIESIGLPAILKTRRLGYDGKGQVKLTMAAEAQPAYAAIASAPAILESVIAFDREVSVVAARGIDGAFLPFEVTENEHQNHILHRSTVPANVSAKLADQALQIARGVAEALDYIGVFAVEFFVAGDALYVNEIAPRVHNSGHWTLDGALTSQFEQHMRAVAGFPLGAAGRLASKVTMTNLIAQEAESWAAILAEPGANLHLYGKTETRPGRKMGHVTRLSPRQA